ncbi:MAG: DUF503 domain-containing protein [Anaerolineae bacterium]|jgi:uncharacterized protein|nr:DUF503 domain-containing protein [Anaerolineae bacterium]
MLALLTLHLHIPGCKSLKEKRSRLKPLLTRLHKEFNISVAEMDLNDVWQSTIIGCAVVSNNSVQAQRTLQAISAWVEKNWYDMTIVDESIEII